jgi:FlaA1/EpsC-like NDP-sugar epimerase
MIKFLIKLPRYQKQATILLFDVLVILGSIVAAFSLRLGYLIFPIEDPKLEILILISPLIGIPIFIQFGLYREVIRYVSFRALWQINKAVSLYAVIWGLLVFMSNVEIMPRSVILINWLLLIILVSGSRLLASWILARKNKNNVVIYGAGFAGRELTNALIHSSEYNPVAFIDDDEKLYRQSINGFSVYSPDDLKKLIVDKDVKEVLLAIPSLSRARRKKIVNFLEHFSVVVRSLPSVSQLVKGKATVNDLLDIDVKDLLGRDPVKPNNKLLITNISNKVVMVTGAGGSIGSELCRQIILMKPKILVLYEMSESALYQIDQELREKKLLNIEVCSIIGSVSDKDRALKICEYFGVQTIYHAAAYKHVPLVEYNQSQGVYNNTLGTMLLAEAAIASNVETFVLISTDKAVRPTNYMGASKRAAEMVLQALAKLPHNTCFTMVRFGNVLDSSGSVIPLFSKQIKDGGPVTVTHSDIVRYFMTIPEAVELVIQAGAMSKGGEVFVLDMGEPIRIYDLAVKMINLSGLQVLDENNPEGDIEIHFTGLRPGEKLFEELLVEGEFYETNNKLIMRAEEQMMPWDKLEPLLIELYKKGTYTDSEKLYNLLKKIVPEFKPK